MERGKSAIKKKLYIVTIVLGMHWVHGLLLWVYNWYLLTQESYLLLSYIVEWAIGVLWGSLLIYYIAILRKNNKKAKRRFTFLRNMLGIVTFVYILQKIWVIPSSLGGIFGEFFWENDIYIIYACYLLLFILAELAVCIYYLFIHKDLEVKEGKKERLPLLKNKMTIVALVVLLQCMAGTVEAYVGWFVALRYPFLLLIMWVIYWIYYSNAEKKIVV